MIADFVCPTHKVHRGLVWQELVVENSAAITSQCGKCSLRNFQNLEVQPEFQLKTGDGKGTKPGRNMKNVSHDCLVHWTFTLEFWTFCALIFRRVLTWLGFGDRFCTQRRHTHIPWNRILQSQSQIRHDMATRLVPSLSSTISVSSMKHVVEVEWLE